MSQTWNDLLFAHWPVDADVLRPLVPTVFELGGRRRAHLLNRDSSARRAGPAPFRQTPGHGLLGARDDRVIG